MKHLDIVSTTIAVSISVRYHKILCFQNMLSHALLPYWNHGYECNDAGHGEDKSRKDVKSSLVYFGVDRGVSHTDQFKGELKSN